MPQNLAAHGIAKSLSAIAAKPLLARYDLKAAARTFSREALADRPLTMWRYAEVLPPDEPVTLGEGMTPMLFAPRLGKKLGLDRLYVKDEGLNPTGSFKARGIIRGGDTRQGASAQRLWLRPPRATLEALSRPTLPRRAFQR